jgi:hypothetical protein
MPIPRAPLWSLTLDCAFAATGLEGAIGARGGGALYSRTGVLAWYGPGFFGMALGTPRGMVVDCRVLVCGFERKIFGRKHVREQLRSLDPSSPAIPTTSLLSLSHRSYPHKGSRPSCCCVTVLQYSAYLWAMIRQSIDADPAYCCILSI